MQYALPGASVFLIKLGKGAPPTSVFYNNKKPLGFTTGRNQTFPFQNRVGKEKTVIKKQVAKKTDIILF